MKATFKTLLLAAVSVSLVIASCTTNETPGPKDNATVTSKVLVDSSYLKQTPYGGGGNLTPVQIPPGK